MGRSRDVPREANSRTLISLFLAIHSKRFDQGAGMTTIYSCSSSIYVCVKPSKLSAGRVSFVVRKHNPTRFGIGVGDILLPFIGTPNHSHDAVMWRQL